MFCFPLMQCEEANMAAACSLFKILLRKCALPCATNLNSIGNSKVLFPRYLCYASRNLYPEDQGRKIMVAGLREGEHETDRESLEHYFKSYGPIERAKLVRDQLTGKSKGYGFVTFRNPKVVEKILSVTNHSIDGKAVRVLIAVKPLQTRSGVGWKDIYPEDLEERKIFVSALKTGVNGTTEQSLNEYFSGFGEVQEVKIIYPKSYGFVTFKDPESVKEVLLKPSHMLAGWRFNVERPFRGKDKSDIIRKGTRTVNVYNVSSETSDDELINHFSIFGEVEKIIGRDSDSKQSSQCMVVFKTATAAKMALEQPLHEIASRGKMHVKPLSSNNASKTILLKGAPEDITLEELQRHFEQFGEIVRMDLTTDHHRPTHVDIHGVLYRTCIDWPTIEFQDARTVENVLSQRSHTICGEKVEIKNVDGRAMNSGAHSLESDRSMMVLINNLPRNVSKKTVVDYFASLSVMVQSVEFRMESDETMSCVVGFWNLDDVDDVVNQASTKDGTVFIGGKPAFVRRLHWESVQEDALL